MSDFDQRPGMCAAFGCPLFGSMAEDEGGKWYCFCHVRQPHALNDAITAELNRQRPLVDLVLAARRDHRTDGALERELSDRIGLIGQQQIIPTAPVTGPTHAAQPYSEPA